MSACHLSEEKDQCETFPMMPVITENDYYLLYLVSFIVPTKGKVKVLKVRLLASKECILSQLLEF